MPGSPHVALCGWFMAASVVGMGLLAARAVVTQSLGALYLPWNLFLAWLPLGLALLTRWLALAHPPRRWLLVLTGAAWLLFLPNAPYILTDLIHLTRVRPGPAAPLWFDLLLHLTVATTGLLLGFASLAVMQGLVSRAWGRVAGWGFAVASLALSGLGIYIGRFLRWNSWDVLVAPGPLLADVTQRLANPLSPPRAYGFSSLCFVFLLLTYLMCLHLPRLHVALEAKPDA